MYSYTPSRRDYGQHKFAIHNDRIVSATISETIQNARGIVTHYKMVLMKEGVNSIGIRDREVFTVLRKHTFDSEEVAKKTLFQLKLKGLL